MSREETRGWYHFQMSSAKGADFKISKIEGQEGLGRPYCFDIDLVTDTYNLDFDSLLGEPAILYISPAGADQVFYHGVITRFEAHFEVVEDKLLIKARLEPSMVRLRDNIFNEVYVDNANGLTTADLIKQVLEKVGLQDGRDFETRLSAPPRPRSFIMQYEESYYDFLHRWLEFEGAYYYFEQGESYEKIIFVDAIASLPAKKVELKYRPVGMFETELYRSSLQLFNENRTVVPAKSLQQNYNYRHASDTVRSEQSVGNSSWGRVMSFGGDIRDANAASHYAKLRAEAQTMPGHMLKGTGMASGLLSGIGIQVSGHPRDKLNSDFRVITLKHHGTQTGYGLAVTPSDGTRAGTDAENFYTTDIEAIPMAVEFRLPLAHPRPRISGYLPGFIDAEGAGKAAEVDRYGRYKVDFPFDYTDHKSARASAWVRLATPYGGQGQSNETGMHFPLLKGAEVMLTFLDGDPDQPVIAGVLPNSLTPTPVNANNNTLNRIVSTSSNELHMDDTPGSQGIRMRSSNGSAMFIMGSFGGKFGNLLPEEMDQAAEPPPDNQGAS